MEIYNNPCRFKIIRAGRRFGKALALDTPILKSDFTWSSIGELNEGDWIFDETGNPVMVSHTSPVYLNRSCFKVMFSDGSEIVADGEHEWITEDQPYRKNKSRVSNTKSKPEKRTTIEILKTLLVKRKDNRIQFNHSIPVILPLQGLHGNLPLDPYVLGIWLGDGSSAGGDITNPDVEIEEEINGRGYVTKHFRPIGYSVFTGKTCNGKYNFWKPATIRAELKDLGVFKNKHIPRQYLSADVHQRIDLLCGLMDSDGTISKEGHCEFSVCNQQLALGFRDLITGLGIKSTLTVSEAKLYGVAKSLRYRITFSPPFNPFILPRKRERFKEKYSPSITRRYVVGVVPIESVPVKCIMVDNESHLFLAGRSLIATHNSRLASRAIIVKALEKPGGMYFVVAPVVAQTAIIWREIKRFLPDELIAKEYVGDRRIILKNGTMLWARSGDNPDTLRGEGLDGCILDEAAMLRKDVWTEAIRPALADKMGWAWLISTPRGKNWFYKECLKGESTDPKYAHYASFHFTSYDNPFLRRSEIDAMAEELPDLSFRQEILAEFVEGGGIVFQMFRECIRDDLLKDYQHGRLYCMGVDLGRKQDFNVIFVGDMESKEIVYFERFTNMEWTIVESKIIDVYKQYRSPITYIDSTGKGEPIYERLCEAGVNCIGINLNVGTKPMLIKALKLAFDRKQIFIPDIPVICEELESYTFVVSVFGNVQYKAPEGFHDDTVIALSLVNYGMNGANPSCFGMIGDDVDEDNPYNEMQNAIETWDDCIIDIGNEHAVIPELMRR